MDSVLSSAGASSDRGSCPRGPGLGFSFPSSPGGRFPRRVRSHGLPQDPPETRGPRREGRGRPGRGGSARPGTHVLAVTAPREPGRRRDKSADCPAGKTSVAGGTSEAALGCWRTDSMVGPRSRT